MGSKCTSPSTGKNYYQIDENAEKHIFVVGAVGAGKSTAMSVLYNPTLSVKE